MIHGFCASVWAYGSEHTDPKLRLDDKMGIETLKATGYGVHMRCREIVNPLFPKGHIVDPTQARPYRLVNGFLDILLKGGPTQSRVLELWRSVNQASIGIVARTKQTLDRLQIQVEIGGHGPPTFNGQVLKDDAKLKA